MNKFASTVIYVPGSAKAVLDFYVTAYGLELKHYDEAFDFGELNVGESSIVIANHSAGEFMVGESYSMSGDGNPQNVEIAFTSDDVESSFQKAVENGCEALCSPKEMPWGQTVAYVKSIEGTLVGFLSKLPAA